MRSGSVVALSAVFCLILCSHRVAACSFAAAQAAVQQCEESCCGSSGCTCEVACTSSTNFTCWSGVPKYDVSCTYADCVQSAVSIEGCISDPAFSDMYLSVLMKQSRCTALQHSKSCGTYSAMETAMKCLGSLSCLRENATMCTAGCYVLSLQCFFDNGCNVNDQQTVERLDYCKAMSSDTFSNCLGTTESCYLSGGSPTCIANHWARCSTAVSLLPVAASPPSSASSAASGTDGTLLAIVIVLAVMLFLLFLALLAIVLGAIKVSSDRGRSGGQTPQQTGDDLGEGGGNARDLGLNGSQESGGSQGNSGGNVGNFVGKQPSQRYAFGAGRGAPLSPAVPIASQQISDVRARKVAQMLMRGMWQKGRLVGKGANGSVFTCILGDGSFVAMKSIDARAMSKADAEQLSSELRVMAQLRHPHIIRYFHAAYDDNAKEVNLWMEFVHGGSLGALVKRLDEPLAEGVVKTYTKQILTGLAYLHASHVVHRDIKADNILIDANGVVKVADFGSAKLLNKRISLSGVTPGNSVTTMNNKYTDTIVGTPLWMAPEVVNPENRGNGSIGYNTKADIWSVGITVSELLDRGRPPWPEFTTAWAALFHIGNMMEPPQLPENISTECRDFMEKCLSANPAERPTATELLTHPWLDSGTESLDSYDDISASFEFRDAIDRITASAVPEMQTSASVTSFTVGGGGGDNATNVRSSAVAGPGHTATPSPRSSTATTPPAVNVGAHHQDLTRAPSVEVNEPPMRRSVTALYQTPSGTDYGMLQTPSNNDYVMHSASSGEMIPQRVTVLTPTEMAELPGVPSHNNDEQ